MSGAGQQLYIRAKARIPGGTQLLSKRPELMLPGQWPAYYSRARGVEVWDLDGRHYTDMGTNGIGACVLGAADPDVDAAVRGAIDAGTMSTLNCPEEVELADLLCELHPWADKVRFARGGGEAMVMAVRIARAGTGRDHVAFCGYHGWHDWYLSANLACDRTLDGHLLPGLAPAGVPRGLTGTTHAFEYNHGEQLAAIVAEHGSQLAAIVMEPQRGHAPEPGFLEQVRQLATACGAVLIFDEITAGWRVNTGGIHLQSAVRPDIAVFAKAMSNGYPMAAVIGTAAAMDAAQDTFISSTYWTERIGPVAALATIRKHRRCDVGRHLVRIGQRVQTGWRAVADEAGLAIRVGGLPPLAHLSFEHEQSAGLSTLFTQELLARGYLAGDSFYATYAHQTEHVDAYLATVHEVFGVLVQAIERNRITQMLKGPVAQSGFRRLT